MLKDSIEKNNSAFVNSREMERLKKVLPQYFDKDGFFKLKEFKNMLSTEEIDLNKEGYGLDFLGKSYAKYESALETETVLTPDINENEKEVNKNSDNLYIVGDNLDGLKHLLKSYSNEIKTIYIDPPYNTGTDGFVYPDSFTFNAEEMSKNIGIEKEEAERIIKLAGKSTHSAWLTFMYPRLLLSRDLLSEDGVIFISIDDNEYSNLKLICDEIFGEENFVNNIIWKKKYGIQNDATYFSTNHDYILVYAKSISNYNQNLLPRTNEQDNRYKNRDDDPRGPWKIENFTVPHVSENRQYPVTTPSGKIVYPSEGRSWNASEEELQDLINDNRIWFGVNGNSMPSKKSFLSEVKQGVTSSTIWEYTDVGHTDSANRYLKDLFNNKAYFDYPKSVDLIKRIVTLGSNEDSIILDFFAGSSTTAEAVMKKNAEDGGKRKYIMVQLNELIPEKKAAYKDGYRTIDEIGRLRIEKAAEKIKRETAADIDYGFKTYIINKIPENTINKLENFNLEDNTNLLSVDFSTDVYSFNGVSGKDTILTTLLNKDGYGLGVKAEPYRLDSYEALIKDSSLYIIDEGLTSDDAMALVRDLENSELIINRVVVYAHSISFSVLHELRNNLKNLKNSRTVHLIEEY